MSVNCLFFLNIFLIKKTKGKMRVFENACDCRLCRGELPPAPNPGERIIFTGGRCPKAIYLNQDEYYVFYYAKAVERGIPKMPHEIARFDASVHDCHKVRKHQMIVVFTKNYEAVKDKIKKKYLFNVSNHPSDRWDEERKKDWDKIIDISVPNTTNVNEKIFKITLEIEKKIENIYKNNVKENFFVHIGEDVEDIIEKLTHTLKTYGIPAFYIAEPIIENNTFKEWNIK